MGRPAALTALTLCLATSTPALAQDWYQIEAVEISEALGGSAEAVEAAEAPGFDGYVTLRTTTTMQPLAESGPPLERRLQLLEFTADVPIAGTNVEATLFTYDLKERTRLDESRRAVAALAAQGVHHDLLGGMQARLGQTLHGEDLPAVELG